MSAPIRAGDRVVVVGAASRRPATVEKVRGEVAEVVLDGEQTPRVSSLSALEPLELLGELMAGLPSLRPTPATG